ncbi:MAG: class I SAM-dependent methyltransferase [Nitrososphaerales archaeon]|nr:class I SAM-dependent methyltransferase [Nitrososphaerales archaeon]
MIKRKCCGLCGSHILRTLFLKNGARVVRCEKCGFIFVNSVLNESTMATMYSQSDRADDLVDLNFESHRAWHQKRVKQRMAFIHFRKRAEEIEKLMRVGRILDVGCSTGLFLDIMKARGWCPYGLEPNQKASKYAREFGLNVSTQTLKEANLPSAFFDVITLWEVIEHFVSPISALLKIKHALREGGIVGISTPNMNGLVNKALKEHSRHFDVQHVNYFTPKTLGKLMNKTGFEVVKMRTEKLDFATCISHISGKQQRYKKLFYNLARSLELMASIFLDPLIARTSLGNYIVLYGIVKGG